ncbi:MAG: GWxTD domain-containing protein [bacterium]|nr:GWxTD domain-containing protein [bacterium]
MKNKKVTVIGCWLLLIFLLAGGGITEAAKIKRKQLPEKYRKWLDLVEYIITKEEKGTFFRITNDRDREVFISLFWNLRDPTPGTEQNEFKDEHLRRFEYVNRYFKFGSPRAGWKTDMGMIYLVIGEPSSRSQYPMDSVIYPSEIWSYYGNKRIGLPASFRIVFWKDRGIGEFKIYDPSFNNPSELIRQGKTTHDLDPTDIQSNFEFLQGEHPELAKASLSLVPDDAGYDFTPSLRSRELLNNVIKYPQNRINDSYATNFLKYKGKVEVDYSINYVESLHRAMVVKDPGTGLNFVHFSIRPRQLSAQSLDGSGAFFFNFILNVSLYQGNRPVFEYRKNFPYTGDKENVLKTFYNSMIISDVFPVAEGRYRLSVLLQNTVNKEFTFFDDTITVSGAAPPKPVISGLMLSREVKKQQRQVFFPFKFREMEVTPDPGKEFGTKDNVVAVFALERGQYTGAVKGMIEVKHLTDEDKYRKDYSFELAADPNLDVKWHTLSRELETMPPGYYTLSLRLKGEDGVLLDEKVERFTVSFKEHVPGTTHLFKTIAAGNSFLHYHILGLQYMRLSQLAKAQQFLSRAMNLRPGYGRLIKDFCALLIKRKQFDRVLETVESLKNNEKDKFDYHAFKGKALFFKGHYKEALTNLTEANRLYDSDVSVLNYLGFSYLKTGNKIEAKKVFAASLKLNDQQKSIAEVLKGI